MTEPTRWRSDPSRQAAADLLLRAARRPRPPSPGDVARLSRVVCEFRDERRCGNGWSPACRPAWPASCSRWRSRPACGRGVEPRTFRARSVSGRPPAVRTPRRGTSFAERTAEGGHSVACRRPQGVAAAGTQGGDKVHAPGAAAVATRFAGSAGARNGAHRRRARRHWRRSERGARETGRPSARISPRPARAGARVPGGGGTPQVESDRRGARTALDLARSFPVELLRRPRNHGPRGHPLSR